MLLLLLVVTLLGYDEDKTLGSDDAIPSELCVPKI